MTIILDTHLKTVEGNFYAALSRAKEPPISEIAFTPIVKAAQEKRGSRKSYAKMEQRGEQDPWRDVVTPELAKYIAGRDELYLGTASADGQPYIQYRGGPKGFLKVLDEHTLAFADYAGNAQYISLGNLTENNKAFIFLMDYPNRHRVQKLQQCIAGLEETILSLRKQLGEAAPEPAVSEPSAQLIAALITEAPYEGPGCGIR